MSRGWLALALAILGAVLAALALQYPSQVLLVTSVACALVSLSLIASPRRADPLRWGAVGLCAFAFAAVAIASPGEPRPEEADGRLTVPAAATLAHDLAAGPHHVTVESDAPVRVAIHNKSHRLAITWSHLGTHHRFNANGTTGTQIMVACLDTRPCTVRVEALPAVTVADVVPSGPQPRASGPVVEPLQPDLPMCAGRPAHGDPYVDVYFHAPGDPPGSYLYVRRGEQTHVTNVFTIREEGTRLVAEATVDGQPWRAAFTLDASCQRFAEGTFVVGYEGGYLDLDLSMEHAAFGCTPSKAAMQVGGVYRRNGGLVAFDLSLAAECGAGDRVEAAIQWRGPAPVVTLNGKGAVYNVEAVGAQPKSGQVVHLEVRLPSADGTRFPMTGQCYDARPCTLQVTLQRPGGDPETLEIWPAGDAWPLMHGLWGPPGPVKATFSFTGQDGVATTTSLDFVIAA